MVDIEMQAGSDILILFTKYLITNRKKRVCEWEVVI